MPTPIQAGKLMWFVVAMAKTIGTVRLADTNDGATGWIVSENLGNDAIAQSNDPLAGASTAYRATGYDHTARSIRPYRAAQLPSGVGSEKLRIATEASEIVRPGCSVMERCCNIRG